MSVNSGNDHSKSKGLSKCKLEIMSIFKSKKDISGSFPNNLINSDRSSHKLISIGFIREDQQI